MVNDCGNAVATEEVPEGSQVAVIAMPCHPLWKTDKGIKAGCPANFGCPDVQYRPTREHGKYSPIPTIPTDE